ncbi:MAG: trypsin-like peptidase domain-containing protein [Acidobacteria bacterium]|nr:trypsin-like peptidase domain-containing protein [Acidobacteriota bacterium]
MSRTRAFFLFSLVVGVVLGLLISTGIQRALSPGGGAGPESPPGARAAASAPVYDEDERRTIELFETAAPSVAYITTEVRQIDFWTRNVFEVPRGTGSGFLWDDQGHVVTNYHVVEDVAQGRGSAKVTLGDDDFDTTLVGHAEDQDLAVLRIDAPPERLVPIRIGTSGDLRVGQKVNAIGNPFGYDYTLTTGIVSALGRTIPAVTGITIFDVIQTDAAINPGNSGGPLLDSGGRLIGVNTQIASPSGASAGIGFAVPVDTVSRIVPDLIQYGRVVRPVLGVYFHDRLSAVVTRRLGVEGVLVRAVAPGGGAAAAGLEGTEVTRRGRVVPGHIIQKIDGKKVSSQADLLGRLGGYRPGDTVTLTVWRDGETSEVEVRLQAPSP